MTTPRPRIGTCSWRFPSWTGLVYSAAEGIDHLAEYAGRYDTVEVATALHGARQTPGGDPPPQAEPRSVRDGAGSRGGARHGLTRGVPLPTRVPPATPRSATGDTPRDASRHTSGRRAGAGRPAFGIGEAVVQGADEPRQVGPHPVVVARGLPGLPYTLNGQVLDVRLDLKADIGQPVLLVQLEASGRTKVV